jgi:hypothetical protein
MFFLPRGCGLVSGGCGITQKPLCRYRTVYRTFLHIDLNTALNQRRNPAADYSHLNGSASFYVEQMKCNSDGPLMAGLRPPAPNPRSPSGGHLRPSQADPNLPDAFCKAEVGSPIFKRPVISAG